MTAEDILFRAHLMGKVMIGVSKGWNVEKSLTCKRELVKIHREYKFNRRSFFSNKYTQKGILMEEDAISLYSRYRKRIFKKNKVRLFNNYFTGEYDLKEKRETIDLKCSWGLDTFPHTAVDDVDSDYVYQGHVYMNLSDADRHTVAYCLVNAPARLITNAKMSLWYEMDCPDDTNYEYLEKKIQIEQNMIFDLDQFVSDNPNYDFEDKDAITPMSIEDRVVEFTFERCDKTIQAMMDRVTESRDWMNQHLFKTVLQ